MALRTVRLDERTERTLQTLRKTSGLSISEVLKRGIAALATQAQGAGGRTPYEIYRQIELGAGGWAVAPGRDAKRRVRDAIVQKHRK